MSDIIKLGKKIFTVGVVATTIFWSVGVATLVPAVANAADSSCPTLVAGDMVKVTGKPAIYAVNNDLKVLYFPSGDEFKSWRPTYGGYKSITQACFDSLAVPSAYPGAVNYRPGSYVVKRPSSDQLYVVEPGNTLAKITVAAAKALYGTNYKVMTVQDAFWPHYVNRAADVTEAKVVPGMTVKNGGTTYYVNTDNTLSTVSAEGMTANAFQAKFVYSVADSAIAGLSAGSPVSAEVKALTDKTQSGGVTGATLPATTVTGGTLNVTLTSDTPVAGSAANGAIRVPFTKVNLQNTGSNDVTVDSIVVERQGYAVDGSLASVILLDLADNSRIGLDQTLNAIHQATFTDDVVVKAGTTKTIMVAGNIVASGHTGEIPKLAVTAVNMKNSATINGTLPLVGNGMTVVSLSTGTLTVARGSNDPGAAVTDKPLGTTGYIFTGLRLTAGSNEDLSIETVTFYQAGSAASSDLKNVKVILDGTEYATTISADGKYYTANFGGIALNKGLNKEMYVKADVMSGAARTVRFDVYRRTDLVVKGKAYGFYASPTASTEAAASVAGAFSTSNPWYQGYQVTMASGGSLRIDKGTLAAGNISEGSTSQVLGDFNFVVDGEAVKITQLILTVDVTNTASANDFSNVTLYDESGAAVAGPTDAVEDSTASKDGTVTWTGTIVVPPGTHKYTVKGNLSTDFATNDTVRVGFTTPATDITATGSDTGNTVTPTPASDVYSNLQTVKAGALQVRVSSVPVNQSVVKGTTDFTFANYIFDASESGEDIKVTTFVPRYAVTAVTNQTDVTSVRLYGYDGTTDGVQLNTGSNVKNPASSATLATTNETFTLDKPLVIPKGTSKTLVLKGNISATAAGTSINWGLTGTSSTYITAVGVSTGSAPTLSGATGAATPGNGATMTLASAGQFSIALDAGRPTAQLYVAGTTGNEVNRLRFVGTTEPISITNLRLKLDDYTATSSDQDIVKAYLYDTDGKLLADAAFSQGIADFTIPMAVSGSYNPFTIDKDSEKVMVVKLDLATISTSASIGTSGHSILVDYDYNASDTTKNQGKGTSSGSTIAAFTADTDNSANRGYVYKGVPKFTKIDTTTFASGSAVYKFKVEADSRGGEIDLYQFTFQITTTSQTTGANMDVSQLDLVDVTGAAELTLVSSAEPGFDGANTELTGHDLVFMLRASPGTWTLGTTPLTIAPGNPHTFELRSTMTGVGTGAAFNTKLLGDSAFMDDVASGHMVAAATVAGGTYPHFVWSDKHASSHSAITLDWTNGYLVAGLPSSNLAPTVLSK